MDGPLERLAKHVDPDPVTLRRLAQAITDAVVSSQRSHPQIIAADPSDHKISRAEQVRRVNWCAEYMIEKRRDARWTIERICDTVSGALDGYLSGVVVKPGLERSWLA